jgi:hypothetical protein
MCEILHKLGAAAIMGALVWGLSACAVPPAAAHRAALAVVHGDGTVQTACVDFDQAEISGLELLDRSGLDYRLDATNPMGALVCRVETEGCDYPAQTCLCQCTLGTACRYWAYFNRGVEADWVYAVSGPSSRQVHDGEADAWVWLTGDQTSTSVPPTLVGLTFAQICGTSPIQPTTSP